MSSHADEGKSTDTVMSDAAPAVGAPISANMVAPATPAAAQTVLQLFLQHLQAAGLDIIKCLDDAEREHQQRPLSSLHRSSSSSGSGVPAWHLDQPHSLKNRLERHCATLSPADILQSDSQRDTPFAVPSRSCLLSMLIFVRVCTFLLSSLC